MKFRDWITAKYVEWRGDAIGNERSITDFARLLGIDKGSMSLWMKGSREPSLQSAIKIARRFTEVYSILGMPAPESDSIQFEDIPEGLSKPLRRAFMELKSTYRARNIGLDSPEADRIAIEIFERHGFKHSKTVEDESEI